MNLTFIHAPKIIQKLNYFKIFYIWMISCFQLKPQVKFFLIFSEGLHKFFKVSNLKIRLFKHFTLQTDKEPGNRLNLLGSTDRGAFCTIYFLVASAQPIELLACPIKV